MVYWLFADKPGLEDPIKIASSETTSKTWDWVEVNFNRVFVEFLVLPILDWGPSTKDVRKFSPIFDPYPSFIFTTVCNSMTPP